MPYEEEEDRVFEVKCPKRPLFKRLIFTYFVELQLQFCRIATRIFTVKTVLYVVL